MRGPFTFVFAEPFLQSPQGEYWTEDWTEIEMGGRIKWEEEGQRGQNE